MQDLLKKLGVVLPSTQGADVFDVFSPIDGAKLASLPIYTPQQVTKVIDLATQNFTTWRNVPMPVRGRLVGIYGEVLRAHKADLAQLVTLEAGKITSEALGEVQEMIDIAEYAVGLSRSLNGLTLASELPNHVLQERWHPKGVVGIISAFNFPVAVWMWNFALSAVCGNTHVWKPSEKTPLTALACQALLDKALTLWTTETAQAKPQALNAVLLGAAPVGQALVADRRVALVSATGSCAMGQKVQAALANDLGRTSLLELGGNNAVIITPQAPLKLAIQATLFGAIGTSGQRCTTTRRLFVHTSLFDKVKDILQKAYAGLDVPTIGNPQTQGTLIGPLIDKAAFESMQAALKQAAAEGGQVLAGGQRVLPQGLGDQAFYLRPALVQMPKQTAQMLHEVFAPILYIMPYNTLDEAVALNNAAEQGLSAAIFTNDLREAEQFLQTADCGIVNVNNGTSGAEIGGAFGGNKTTGGGRESGSNAWQAYMNRSTNRINYAPSDLKLAQGVQFNINLEGVTN
jgi:aldehyde dehydrogenase (NAD+)